MSRKWIFVTLFLVVACSHRVPVKPTGLEPRALQAEQLRRQTQLKQITAKLNLSYSGDKRRMSGRGRAAYQYPGKFRLEVRDPLGRLQMEMIYDGKTLLANYPREKVAYWDTSAGQAYLQNFLGMDISVDDLSALLLGMLPERVRQHAPRQWIWSDEGVYRATWTEGESTWVASVDPHRATLMALEWKRQAQTLEVKYSDPMELNSTFLAAGVEIRSRSASHVFSVTWDTIKTSGHAASFQVQPPSDGKIIRLP